MATYLQDYFLYAYISGSQIDITNDAIQDDISAEWGMDNKALSFLADTGTLTFKLNNISGKYSTNIVGSLAGWGKGVVIDLVLIFDNETYHRFRGYVDSLDFDDENYTVSVGVVDWLDYSAKHPIAMPTVDTNQSADNGLNTIISEMPIKPQSTYFEAGISNFSIIFDSNDPKTVAYTEFSKFCNSEPGRIYLQKNKDNGEKLCFENRNHRNGLNTLDQVTKLKSDSPSLLNSTGGKILNSTGGNILIRQYQDLYFNNDMNDINPTYGAEVINSIKVTANPKTFDSASTVLYSLSEPSQIGSMQSIDFSGNYTDSSGKSCNVLTDQMLQPVMTTDYLGNTFKSGSGIDVSASMIVSASYGNSQVSYIITNNSPYKCWVTKLTARGKGIHAFNPTTALRESQTSINKYGYQSATLNQIYQTDLVVGRQLVASILESEKKPKSEIDEAIFLANTDDFLMLSFLNCDIGNLIRIKDDKYGIDSYFYITKIKFNISTGGIIMFTLGLRRAFNLLLGLSLATCTFHAGSTDAIRYGNLPQLIDLSAYSLSAWIYPTATGLETIMSGWVSGTGGLSLKFVDATSIGHGDRVINIVYVHSGGGGNWISTSNVSLNNWHYVVITVDTTLNAPKIYIDGVLDTTITLNTPVGDVGSIDGMDWTVGNIHGQASDTALNKPFIGSIKDPRVYSRILTKDEVTSLYNGGSVTDGLVFQGDCIRTDDIPIYNGITLTPETKLIDNIFGSVASPNNNPTCSIP